MWFSTALRHGAVIIHNDTDFLTLQRAVAELEQLRIVASKQADAR